MSDASNVSPSSLLTHSNYEDGLKLSHNPDRAEWFVTFDAFQLWRWIETDAPPPFRPWCGSFWRIPIMKMDWNFMALWQLGQINWLLTHSNYEDGLKRVQDCTGRITSGLLTHSNYEDGLKLSEWMNKRGGVKTFDAFQLWRWIETVAVRYTSKSLLLFWRIPIMKMDWN